MPLENFTVKELVSPKLYKQKGEKAIYKIDSRLITFLEMFRKYTKKPITINNWSWGGHFEGRGYRDSDNSDYNEFSQHSDGRAIDFDVKDWTPKEVNEWIIKNRWIWWVAPITFLEDDVNWVHIDVRYHKYNSLTLWSPKTKTSSIYKR